MKMAKKARKFESTFLSCLVSFGKWTLLHPLESRNKFYQNAHSCLRLLVALIYPLVFLDGLLTNPVDTLVGSNSLSVKLETMAGFISGIIADTAVRMTSLLHQRDIHTLTFIIVRNDCHSVRSTQTSSAEALRKRMSIVAITLVSALWGIGNVIYTSRTNLAIPLPPEYDMTLLPFGIDAARVAYCITDFFYVISTFYGLLFVVGFGLALTEWFEALAMEVVWLNKPGDGCVHSIRQIKNDVWQSNKVKTEVLIDEFRLMKSGFEIYGRVAGAYCAGLMGNFVLLVIEFLSSVVDSGVGMLPELQELRTFGSFSIIFVFFLASFGNYMANTVMAQQDKVRESHVKSHYAADDQITKLSGWIANWCWKLTAADLFDVDLGLLPGIGATIVTYFIFIFQLKMSEHEATTTAGPWSTLATSTQPT